MNEGILSEGKKIRENEMTLVSSTTLTEKFHATSVMESLLIVCNGREKKLAVYNINARHHSRLNKHAPASSIN